MPARGIALIGTGVLVLQIANAGAEPCSQEIMDVTKKLAASDAALGSTADKPTATLGAQKRQHPRRSLLHEETAGEATSARDGQHQSGVLFDASQALERARGLDAQGKEEECMTEVMNARQLTGL
jgi:hypothetical protein